MTIFRKSPTQPKLPTQPKPIEEERIMDRKTLEELTGYIKRAKSILEHTMSILEHTDTLEETRFTKRTRSEVDKIIIDIRKKLKNAEKVAKECDNSFVFTISEVDMELGKYRDLTEIPSYFALLTDSEKVKKDFVDNCKCSHKTK